ncbi:hypothetical protein FA15DRAFT_567481, partial [Coprinopsis marcescibilis]
SRSFSSSPKQQLRYHPPPRRPPSFFDRISDNTIIYGILGLNILVFGMWYMADQKLRLERDPQAVVWMFKNFTSSIENLKQGRFWTLLTSCFSQRDFSHIIFNAFTFYFTAPAVLYMLGARKFLWVYIGGGLVSSATSLIYANYITQSDRPSLGASGAIFSIVTFLACAAPTMIFRLYGIVPVPAWLLVSGLFGYDAYQTVNKTQGTVDTVGHIGGVLAGIAFFIAMRGR